MKTTLLARRLARKASQARSPQERARYANLACVAGIICNIALCAAKGLVGVLAGSVSVVADALNNLSDAASSIVSLIGFRLASRPADRGHPYGHGRYEYLAGLVVATMVCAVGIELVRTSLEKTLHPEPVEFGWATVLVLLGSIAVKLWMSQFNRAVGEAIDSETLEATAVDARNDVITSATVLAAGVISLLYHVDLDGPCGLVVGAFIVISGIQLVRDTVNPLLGQAPSDELVEHVRQTILSYPGVLGTHDLMVHDYGPGRQFASAHVEMPAEQDVLVSHDTLDTIERQLWEQDGLRITLHLDPILRDDPGIKTLYGWLQVHIRRIDPNLSMHDLRVVPGPQHTHVIFDVVKPYGVELSDEELRRDVEIVVAERVPNATCSITIDHGYVPGV